MHQIIKLSASLSTGIAPLENMAAIWLISGCKAKAFALGAGRPKEGLMSKKAVALVIAAALTATSVLAAPRAADSENGCTPLNIETRMPCVYWENQAESKSGPSFKSITIINYCAAPVSLSLVHQKTGYQEPYVIDKTGTATCPISLCGDYSNVIAKCNESTRTSSKIIEGNISKAALPPAPRPEEPRLPGTKGDVGYKPEVFIACKASLPSSLSGLPADCTKSSSIQTTIFFCKEAVKRVDLYCLAKANGRNGDKEMRDAEFMVAAAIKSASSPLNRLPPGSYDGSPGLPENEKSAPSARTEPSKAGWSISADLRSNQCGGKDKLFIVSNGRTATSVVCGGRASFPSYCEGLGMRFAKNDSDFGCIR